MAVTLELQGRGFWAWLKRHHVSLRVQLLAEIIARAQAQAFVEWATRSGDESLQVRFTERAWGLKGFAPRSMGYQKRQLKAFNKLLPYVSPRSTFNALAVAKAITTTNPNARTILRALQPKGPHARELVRQPIAGFNIRVRQRSRSVKTSMTLPGMRILNRLADPWGSIYRKEFLAFHGGGSADGRWISKRANEIAATEIFAAMARERSQIFVKPVRGYSRISRGGKP
jgi:hypothetical protein